MCKIKLMLFSSVQLADGLVLNIITNKLVAIFENYKILVRNFTFLLGYDCIVPLATVPPAKIEIRFMEP